MVTSWLVVVEVAGCWESVQTARRAVDGCLALAVVIFPCTRRLPSSRINQRALLLLWAAGLRGEPVREMVITLTLASSLANVHIDASLAS